MVLSIRKGVVGTRMGASPTPIGPTLFPTKLLYHQQAIAQVILITCEKPFLLDEIKKHQTAQHERGIPLTITLIGNTPYTEQKLSMFLFETLMEFFGNLLSIRDMLTFSHEGIITSAI